MADISASQVAALRARTGVSILQCKEALTQAGGDEEKAIEFLRKSGAAQAVKKSAREQKEGAIFLARTDGKASMLELNCETDFVARNQEFQEFGQGLADLLLAKGDKALTAHAQEVMPATVQKLGENISLGTTHTVEGAVLGCYVHGNRKIGVIIALEGGDEEKAKDAAMHAAAMAPLYRTPDEVPPEAVEKEKEIWREQLKKESKPEAIWDKIMMGKEKKFREENALVTQPFAKDPSMTVQQYLGDAQVSQYIRMAVS
ncbi:MAG: translation elongation factor Ts [Candidatus Peribacteraceae bacterium]|jgi:elongation factor Ts